MAGPYEVLSGSATVSTNVGPGRAFVDLPRGAIVPDDVPAEEIETLLRRGHIGTVAALPFTVEVSGEQVTVTDAVPPGMSVSTTLQWVGGDRERAQAAFDAEQAAASPRSTLLSRLTVLLG